MSIPSTIFAIAVAISALLLTQGANAASGRTVGAAAANGVHIEKMAKEEKADKSEKLNDYSPAAGAETPSSEQSIQAVEPTTPDKPKKMNRSMTGRTAGAGNSY